MLDEWIGSHLKESLRPINKYLDGKYVKEPIIGEYRLKTGHELWGAGHATFILSSWSEYKREWIKRGGKGFNFDINQLRTNVLFRYPEHFRISYEPTKKDYRHNLARLCERFRNRDKAYHFKGKTINTTKEFLEWLSFVKTNLKLDKK